MLTVSIVLFAVAAVLGMVVAIALLSKSETPKAVVYSHGALAATSLVLLVIYALSHPDTMLFISIGIFVVAALGGFYLFANDLRKRPGPVPLVFVHAIAAVTAFVILLIFAYF